MQKALSIWALRDNEERSADSLFEEVARHGFDGVEPAIGMKGLLTAESTEEECAAVVETASAHGLSIDTLASGLGWDFPLNAGDAESVDRAVELLRESVRVASQIGAETLLVVPGKLAAESADGADHVPYDVALDRIRDGLSRVAPDAEQHGVTLGIENVWNQLLLSPLEMRDFIDGFDSPNVAAYLDVGNMIVTGYAEDWIRILGKRIAAVHFKDYQRAAGTLDGFCDLTEGDVNWPAVMRELRVLGYMCPCTAEYFDLDEEALAKLSRDMDSILAL